jgi:hypothetical protein
MASLERQGGRTRGRRRLLCAALARQILVEFSHESVKAAARKPSNARNHLKKSFRIRDLVHPDVIDELIATTTVCELSAAAVCAHVPRSAEEARAGDRRGLGWAYG